MREWKPRFPGPCAQYEMELKKLAFTGEFTPSEDGAPLEDEAFMFEYKKTRLRAWLPELPPEDAEWAKHRRGGRDDLNPWPRLRVVYGVVAQRAFVESHGRRPEDEPPCWEKPDKEGWYAFAERVFRGPLKEPEAEIVRHSITAYANATGQPIPPSSEHWVAAFRAIRSALSDKKTLALHSELRRKGVLPRFGSALLLLLLLLPRQSLAADPPRPDWHLDGQISYLVLGPTAARATGGFMPSVTARHSLPLKSSSTSLAFGADIGLFGLGNDSQWIGVLGGPVVGIESRPFSSAPVSIELLVRLDGGRIPLCNRWGLCARYLGFFPAGELGLSYSPADHLAAVVACGTRFIHTLSWTGLTIEPAAAGRFSW